MFVCAAPSEDELAMRIDGGAIGLVRGVGCGSCAR
jgi:hypothetical protein